MTTPQHVRNLNAAASKGATALTMHVDSLARVRDYTYPQLVALADHGHPEMQHAAKAELQRRAVA